MGRSEVWRWNRITWSCPGGMEDRKVTAVIAAWWCHRRDMRESSRMESFLYYLFLIESLTFVIF